MALFAGLNTPQPTDPQNRAKQGSGNLGRGLLQLFMMQNEAGATAKKAGDAKAAQEAGNARVGQVANEVSQLRNSGKDTLAVMDVFRKNGDLFNNPVTRPGMISLAANEKATEDMISGFEKAKIDTIQKKTQSALLTQQIDMASKIAASGGKGSQAIASMFVPNEEGVMPVSDLSNFNTVSSLFAEHIPDAATKPGSTLGKILSDRAAAKAAGRDDEVKIFDAEIASRAAKDGFNIQFDDQGKLIFNYGPQVAGLGKITVATQSRVQQNLLKYEGVSQLLNTVEKNLKPEHVGVRGVAGEFLLDRGLSQLDPSFANKDRIDTRTGMVVARESLLRVVSDDPRFSNQDRDEISKALPSSGVFESVEDAKQRIQTVRRIINQRGKIQAEGTGLPIQLWTQSADEIRALYQSGKVSENDAEDALRRFHNYK